MNAFEYGFYSELEKTGSKTGTTIKRTLLGSAAGGLTGTALAALLMDRPDIADATESNKDAVHMLRSYLMGGVPGKLVGGTAGLVSGLMSKDKKELKKKASASRALYSGAKGALLGGLLGAGVAGAHHLVETEAFDRAADEARRSLENKDFGSIGDFFGINDYAGMSLEESLAKQKAEMLNRLSDQHKSAITGLGATGGVLAAARRLAKDSTENKQELKKKASIARPAYSTAKGALLGGLLGAGVGGLNSAVQSDAFEASAEKIREELAQRDFGLLGKLLGTKAYQQQAVDGEIAKQKAELVEKLIRQGGATIKAGGIGGGALAFLRRMAKDSQDKK